MCYLEAALATSRSRRVPNTSPWSPGGLVELNSDVPVEGVDRETYMAARMPDQARLEQSHAELVRPRGGSAFISAST